MLEQNALLNSRFSLRLLLLLPDPPPRRFVYSILGNVEVGTVQVDSDERVTELDCGLSRGADAGEWIKNSTPATGGAWF